MQVAQQSQLVLSMSKGQSILCYSKGLIAPVSYEKQLFEMQFYPIIGIALPYLTSLPSTMVPTILH